MSKLFKKSLAFCVAIAMVFTLFAGTISVNAEDAEETLTVTLEVTNPTVEDGAAQVTFPLAVTCSGDTSINVLRLVITTTAGKVSSVVSATETEDYTIYYNGDYALLNAGQTVEDLGGFGTANLVVTVDLNEGLDKEAYDITIDARSENASDANENALKISYETGYIRLLAHTHELSETYTYVANGHWQVCTSDYCEVEGGYTTEVAPHTLEYVNNGDNHTASCSVCDYTVTEDHAYTDNECPCGATETVACEHEWQIVATKDATSEEEGWIDFECTKCDTDPVRETVIYWSRHTFYKRNINMASQIELNFKIREDRFNDANLGTATEAFAKITVNTDFGDETTYITGLEDYAVTVNPGDSRNIRTVVVPLAAKQMMDDVTANTFIKVGEQWYSGAAKTETVEGLAQGIYGDIGETERTLYANLLTYGARAQEYFGYKADTLADANLGDYASYVNSDTLTFDGSIEQTYSTADPEGDSSIRTYKYGLTMAAKTEANLRVRLDKYVPFPDINTVTARLTYGVGDDVIVTDVASSEFTFFESNSSGDRYTFSYADVYPKCMRDDVTLVFYVNGVATDNVVTFSIENIVSKVYGNSTATEQAMYQAMMHYADAAKAHFG